MVLNKKGKGSNAERELLHHFWEQGWASMRAAGSGSTRLPCPDIIAGNGLRTFVIECKVTAATKQYLRKDEIKALFEFSQRMAAIPLVAVKFDRIKWYFITYDNLTKSGENYVISLTNAKSRGLEFDDIIRM